MNAAVLVACVLVYAWHRVRHARPSRFEALPESWTPNRVLLRQADHGHRRIRG